MGSNLTEWLKNKIISFINTSLYNSLFNDNNEKAWEWYQKITKLTTGRLCYGDIYTKSFYMLGKIYERQSNKAKAIEHYSKFLDLWRDADPGIAEVEDLILSFRTRPERVRNSA